MSADESGFGVIHRSLRGRLTANEIAVYIALSWRINDRGQMWARHAVIAQDAGCSSRTVQRALLSLREKEEVTWTPRYGEDGSVVCNTYTLIRLSGGYARESDPLRQKLTPTDSQAPTPRHTVTDPLPVWPTERTTMNETPRTTAGAGAGSLDDLPVIPEEERWEAGDEQTPAQTLHRGTRDQRNPSGASPQGGPKPNRYGGKCARCGKFVDAEEGTLAGREPIHLSCPGDYEAMLSADHPVWREYREQQAG